MNLKQAKELFTLITTVRHVKEMDVTTGADGAFESRPGCLLCEGVRHRLYSKEEGRNLDNNNGFSLHFGCTYAEAQDVVFHHDRIRDGGKMTTGQVYYQAGKELLEKYGFGHLFDSPIVPEKAKSFPEIMAELGSNLTTTIGEV